MAQMGAFPAPQPDEGYSEDPLNPHDSTSSNSISLSGLQTAAELPAWLTAHLPTLSVNVKTQLAMTLLDGLPTSVIAEIVERLNPRLYIDFIRYLPAEVCLKILGYLDPGSLINVARSCRAWYDLALDQKLWERLYHLEGWNSIPTEIQAWEDKVNEHLHQTQTEDVHVDKKRAILEEDGDLEMIDADHPVKVEGNILGDSIFGSPAPSLRSFKRSDITPNLGDLEMDGGNSSSKGKGVDRSFGLDTKGKRKAGSASVGLEENKSRLPSLRAPDAGGCLAKSTLWSWDTRSGRYRINWKYLYTMRRRLEGNWELGKYTNFQLPHPDFPQEGHQECIYSLQYNYEYLVSGSRDRTLRIWNMQTRRLVQPPLAAHTGSVLCLQFDSDPDEDLIVSGSSDSDVILWKFSTGQVMQRLHSAHTESVLNVRFDKRILVTCSKDKTIKIFNRKPLRFGEAGYPMTTDIVYQVPRHVKSYGFEPELPIYPAYSMIGVLHGHSAAVNAVQIWENEVVSASGDRHIKVWDWAQQICIRTIVGHTKGIACVQYDGRRIVSGSSDNEVKVFDRPTGLEVASLRAHTNLVRTVQAGFGDMPYSAEEDRALARKIDQEYFKALEEGSIEPPTGAAAHRTRQRNAGSSRPEDITAYGASIPPGGGGGKYGRIVSGSYDQSIIIWRRDKEGVWKDAHHLRQEEAAAAAQEQASTGGVPPTVGQASAIPLHPSVRPLAPPPSPAQPQAPSGRPPPITTLSDSMISGGHHPQSDRSFVDLIDTVVPRGVSALNQALAAYPNMLHYHSYLQSAIDRDPSPFIRSQLRQTVSAALVRTQVSQNRRREAAFRVNTELAAVTALARNGPGHFGAAAGHGSGGASTAANAGSSTAGGSTSTAPSGPGNTGPASSSGSQGRRNHPIVAVGTSGTASAQDAANAQAAAVNPAANPAAAATTASSNTRNPPLPAPQAATAMTAPPVPTPHHAPHAGHIHQVGVQQPHHPHMAAADNNPARVFKLQFDARRIICCSQTSVIVGWDFCNGDEDLEMASRFFSTVE